MWCELNLSAPIQNYPKPLFEQRLFAILSGRANLSGLKFLSDPGKPGVRSLGPDVCPSQTPSRL